MNFKSLKRYFKIEQTTTPKIKLNFPTSTPYKSTTKYICMYMPSTQNYYFRSHLTNQYYPYKTEIAHKEREKKKFIDISNNIFPFFNFRHH